MYPPRAEQCARDLSKQLALYSLHSISTQTGVRSAKNIAIVKVISSAEGASQACHARCSWTLSIKLEGFRSPLSAAEIRQGVNRHLLG